MHCEILMLRGTVGRLGFDDRGFRPVCGVLYETSQRYVQSSCGTMFVDMCRFGGPECGVVNVRGDVQPRILCPVGFVHR